MLNANCHGSLFYSKEVVKQPLCLLPVQTTVVHEYSFNSLMAVSLHYRPM